MQRKQILKVEVNKLEINGKSPLGKLQKGGKNTYKGKLTCVQGCSCSGLKDESVGDWRMC